MRIVFVLSGLGAGGAEKIVNLLAHHRSMLGDDVHVLAFNADTAESYFVYSPTISVVPLDVRSKKGSGPAGKHTRILRLRRYVRTVKPDLIVSFLTKINILARIACCGLGIPLVMSERNNFQSQEMSAVWRIARPIAARAAAQLVMQTENARHFLPDHLRTKSVVIPNPVNIAQTQRLLDDEDAIRIVAVGRMEGQKGFDRLLDGFRLVADRVPNATLTIFGDGPLRQNLQDQANALSLADRVSMPGITRTPGEWTARGDIFVLSSRFEGFPNVLLEAMMSGLASIAFDCPWGPSEILDLPDSGLLVPNDDVQGLADAMYRLTMDTTLRRRLAENGARLARERYAVSPVLEKWDRVIATAIQ